MRAVQAAPCPSAASASPHPHAQRRASRPSPVQQRRKTGGVPFLLLGMLGLVLSQGSHAAWSVPKNKYWNAAEDDKRGERRIAAGRPFEVGPGEGS
jgi:hypothetical protein